MHARWWGAGSADDPGARAVQCKGPSSTGITVQLPFGTWLEMERSASTNGAPHGQYGTFKPLQGNPKTCVELAVDYLDSIAR